MSVCVACACRRAGLCMYVCVCVRAIYFFSQCVIISEQFICQNSGFQPQFCLGGGGWRVCTCVYVCICVCVYLHAYNNRINVCSR